MINNDSQVIRAAAILTNGYVAGNVLDTQNASQINLLVKFTIGSLTSASIKVEFSDDGTDYYQETFEDISGGAASASLGVHTIAATGNYRFSIPAEDKWMRVSAIGTGTVTGSSMEILGQLGNA